MGKKINWRYKVKCELYFGSYSTLKIRPAILSSATSLWWWFVNTFTDFTLLQGLWVQNSQLVYLLFGDVCLLLLHCKVHECKDFCLFTDMCMSLLEAHSTSYYERDLPYRVLAYSAALGDHKRFHTRNNFADS